MSDILEVEVERESEAYDVFKPPYNMFGAMDRNEMPRVPRLRKQEKNINSKCRSYSNLGIRT